MIFEGGTSSLGWSNSSLEATIFGGLNDRHISTAEICLDLTSDQMLTLDYAMSCYYFSNYGASYRYAWFRVLADGVVLADVDGNTSYSAYSGQKNLSYDLSAYTGTNVTITLQAAIKYNGNFGATVDIDNVCLSPVLSGCTNISACNYNSAANVDDGSCDLPNGCGDITAFNYDSTVTCSDSTACIPVILGCTDLNYAEYSALANTDDGSCATFIGSIYGCTDSTAFNYNASANVNQVSATDPSDPCVPVILGCMTVGSSNYNASANTVDPNDPCVPCATTASAVATNASSATNANGSVDLTVSGALCTELDTLVGPQAGGNSQDGTVFNLINTSGAPLTISGLFQGGPNGLVNVDMEVWIYPGDYYASGLTTGNPVAPYAGWSNTKCLVLYIKLQILSNQHYH
jgi:hypothetical protein